MVVVKHNYFLIPKAAKGFTQQCWSGQPPLFVPIPYSLFHIPYSVFHVRRSPFFCPGAISLGLFHKNIEWRQHNESVGGRGRRHWRARRPPADIAAFGPSPTGP